MVCLIVSSAASSVFLFLFAIQSVCYSVFYASLRYSVGQLTSSPDPPVRVRPTDRPDPPVRVIACQRNDGL